MYDDDFTNWLTARGVEPETLSAPARIKLEDRWREEHQAAVDGVPYAVSANDPFGLADAAASRWSAVGNDEKARQVRGIGARAFAEDWSLSDTKLALIRGGRGDAPNPYAPSRPDTGTALLEASLLLTAGMPDEAVASHYGDRVTDAAT